MNRLPAFSIVLVWCLLLIAPARLTAAPGDLDREFGGFGTGGQIQNLGFNAAAMAIDAQGRLVLVGDGVQRRSGPQFRTVEQRTGVGGNAVAIAPDGKIVVAGSVSINGHDVDFAVTRLNPDLTPLLSKLAGIRRAEA